MMTNTLANPFALLMDPQAVIAAVESSDPLGRLNRRVYKPLDRPWIPAGMNADAAAFDAMVDEDDEIELDLP